jgi:hypothetical protein
MRDADQAFTWKEREDGTEAAARTYPVRRSDDDDGAESGAGVHGETLYTRRLGSGGGARVERRREEESKSKLLILPWFLFSSRIN